MSQVNSEEYIHKQNDIYNLITSNDIFGIKSYLRKDKVTKLTDILYKKNHDLLIYSIEHNCSPEMVQFIIDNCEYKNVNYTFVAPICGITTPLIAAFCNGDIKSLDMDVYFKGNFEIANLLMKNNADVNYKINSLNILNFLNSHKVLNKNQLNFILDNGFDINLIDSFLINNLSNSFTNIIFRHFVFGKEFIIKLLKYYKEKKPISKKELRDTVDKEKNKIKIKNNWYMDAIHKEKYTKIVTLLNNETIDKNSSFIKIISLLECYDKKNHTSRKQTFLEKIKNKSLEFTVSPDILNLYIIEDIDEQKKKVLKLIKNNNKSELESYVVNNKIILRELNTEEQDLIIYAIENEASLELIKCLVMIGQYKDFNYFIKINNGEDFKTPFTASICHKRFEISDYLIENGADVNYNLLKYYNGDYYNDIINYLYKHDKLDKDTFEYTSSCSNLKSMAIGNELINKLIESSKNEVAKHIINYTSFPISEQWYKIAMLKGNIEMIDILYELDRNEMKNNVVANILINLPDQDLAGRIMNEVENESLKSTLQMAFFSLILISQSRK